MTLIKDFSLAQAHDNAAGLQNIQNLFLSQGQVIPYQPRTTPVPLGAVERVTLDQQVDEVGVKIVRWEFGILPFALLDTLVTTFGAGWAAKSGNVTIRTLSHTISSGAYTFSNYNAVMVTPADGRDFNRRHAHGTNYAVGLTLTFRDLVAL